ncbi:UV DNA damage repair endonuclease UvsE [Clostridium sp. YIM B02515]|uniref:UV DNA damage repair endonuclease UvsE n=1 Tax=Clostridium rhizosphaerae TaxID=2803861 RepID=A0ABS1T992_9CLOT|nr:UV DNA damage repair endonuclease UvsE [Clostridium rhizosphaerae]MBL4935831.1 UV DNA damage repair endonuclease UvsE [Clostridium rhizosphaerae]
MRVRIGYVAIALNLPKVTSSSTVTYTNYQKLSSDEQKLNKLKQVTLSNLDDLYKILQYNVENNVHFYRITSALVPLATHPEVTAWDYRKIFNIDFKRLGKFVKENNMRVDTHPDEFNVINSIREEVVKSSERNLWSHVHLFEDMEYPDGKMVLHIGSAQGGKEEATHRFINNFKKYPPEITSRLMLENDDKTFTASEVLSICRETNTPIVFDVHHHMCNNNGETIEDLISEIFSTWKNQSLPPKFHFSTPRESERDRKHADYINAKDFISFIEICKPLDKDFDVMLEAKMKDRALFQLIDDIKIIKPNWNWIDNTTLEV